MPKQKLFSKFLHEPLFHFLLIGLGFFFFFFQLNPNEDSPDATNIVITQAKVDAMTTSYLKQRGRNPLANEMQDLIENEIREELLYREALALGLDKDDGVIRRRLAQKMKYLFEDLAVIDAPNDEDLEKFLKENASKFTLPGTLSFYQVYLDPKMHKDSLDEEAKTVLEHLKIISLQNAFSLGDRSLLEYRFSKRRESDVKNRFGESFSKKLFKAPIDSWQGPFQSAYGLHFVYIDAKNEAILPELKEVREDVLQAYKREKASEANEIFYKGLKDRYKIKVDDTVLKDTNISLAS
jgi:parvulin-like peptidyl-prolyl isomerase